MIGDAAQKLITDPLPVARTAPASGMSLLRETCWPNELEILLLQAGLWTPERALKAWEKFCASISDIEALGDGCYRLFPLVAGNLQNQKGPVPHLEHICGVLRHAWSKKQTLIRDTTPLFHALQEAGIPFLLLKGAALAAAYRRQMAVRPMVDIDILIRPHDLEKSVVVLGRLGSTFPGILTAERLWELLRFRHEITMRGKAGNDLDVHWYLISDSRDVAAEDSFWEDSVPCDFPAVKARTLCPSDQILHTCMHGTQWNEVSPSRWLADAAILLRDGIDWKRLESQAKRLCQLRPVRDTLLYLNKLEIELPAGVLEHWTKMKMTDIEALEGSYRASRPNLRERTKQLAWIYLRLTRHLSYFEFFRQLPAYMAQIHHFRAYSRRVKFLIYLVFLVLSGRRSTLGR